MTVRFALAAAVACAAAARADGGYDREIGVRLLFAASSPRMFAARQGVRDDNAAMLASGLWQGGVGYGTLAQALGGGVEAGWGATPDLRVVAAIEGRGTNATGSFDGIGAGTVVDPVLGLERQHVDRNSRYPAVGQEAGLTVLLREFQAMRVGLALRVGVWELADAREQVTESGPIRNYGWQRLLTGVAPSGYLGLEWEWLPGPVGVFAAAGYRTLVFNQVHFEYADTAGATSSGGSTFPDGTHFELDFSGPELRAGLQALFTLPPAP